MNAVCGDNRFEIIAKVKEHLIKATNIERQPEELKYADNVLFRLWQLGYFDSVEKISRLEEQVDDLKSDHDYNLELMKGLNEKIAELNKANEWHYPSKGEYPKDNGNVLLLCEPKFKKQHTKGGYFVLGYWSDSRFVQFSPKNDTIIAWKEIVLPKESEE